MIRTSILLPPAIHQELVITSKQEGSTLTDLVRQAVEEWITLRKRHKLQRMYDALDHFVGQGPPGITDASSTIDEVLYGENGAWKGPGEQV